jgi:hypothetical protein
MSLATDLNDRLSSFGLEGVSALEALAARGRADERLQTFMKSPLLGRPGFLEGSTLDRIESDLGVLLDLLLSLPDRYFGGDIGATCDSIGLTGPCRQAVLDTAADSDVRLARADVMIGESGPVAVEFNVHSSLGGMDIAPLNEAFLQLPVFGDFLRASGADYVDPLDGIVTELRRVSAARNLRNGAMLALVDWPTTYPTYRDVLGRLCSEFKARGMPAVHGHVGDLRVRNGQLYLGQDRVDVLYRIFMLEDVPENPALLGPVIAAHRAGTAIMAMTFFGELVGNKASLAILSDPGASDPLTPEERGVVDRVVPQSRLLRPGQTSWDGEPHDVIQLATQLQRELVLKPAIGHGTQGVVAGWTVPPMQWAEEIDKAMGAGFILQQRVRTAPEMIPVLRNGDVALEDYAVNWGIFIQNSRYAGGMLRALPVKSPAIISLSAGGAVGCCFQRSNPR